MRRAVSRPIYEDVEPADHLTMAETAAALEPHVARLSDASGPRLAAGEGAEKIVCSLSPCLGPAARLYPAERAERSGADDMVALYGPGTGRLDALFIGSQIGRWRVGALSLLALRKLFAEPPARVCVFGCGGQARAHIHAIAAFGVPQSVTVVGRDPSRAGAFCGRLERETRLALTVAGDAAAALEGADLIVTTTSATAPLFAPAQAPRDVAIVHVGAKSAKASEIDPQLYREASLLLTDAPAQLAAIFETSVLKAAGRRRDEVASLADPCPRRDGVRIYISLGLAGAEAVIARRLLTALRA